MKGKMHVKRKETETKNINIFSLIDRSGLVWVNDLIQILWLNYRAGIRHFILKEWWPKLKASGHNPYTHGMHIHDFHLGNQPIRIDKITCEGTVQRHVTHEEAVLLAINCQLIIAQFTYN